MSRLHELIKELAPRGVVFQTLGDVGEFVRGSGLSKADLTDEGVPAIHYGQIHTHYDTWAESTKSFTTPALAAKLRRAKPGDLVIATTSEDDAAVAKATAWMGAEEAVVSGDAYIYSHSLDPRYMAYFFQSEQFRSQKRRHITGAKVRRISGEAMAKIRIPVPPREIQEEIVRILDDFADSVSALGEALSSESRLRQSQHTHSREVLLKRGDSVPVEGSLELSELVQFTNGKPHERLVSTNGTVALLTARFISTAGKSARWVRGAGALTPAFRGDIAMVMSDLPNGRALARCFYIQEDGKFTANQRVCLLRVRDTTSISPLWLYHFLDRNPQLLAYDNGQDQTHLKKGQILGIRVPIISLAEQERAANTLHQLDVGVGELVLGLQAEQKGRRKQYDYYRNRLLTFEELAA